VPRARDRRQESFVVDRGRASRPRPQEGGQGRAPPPGRGRGARAECHRWWWANGRCPWRRGRRCSWRDSRRRAGRRSDGRHSDERRPWRGCPRSARRQRHEPDIGSCRHRCDIAGGVRTRPGTRQRGRPGRADCCERARHRERAHRRQSRHGYPACRRPGHPRGRAWASARREPVRQRARRASTTGAAAEWPWVTSSRVASRRWRGARRPTLSTGPGDSSRPRAASSVSASWDPPARRRSAGPGTRRR
jgi:hypothetical protein